jgi:hypothetical protein
MEIRGQIEWRIPDALRADRNSTAGEESPGRPAEDSEAVWKDQPAGLQILTRL